MQAATTGVWLGCYIACWLARLIAWLLVRDVWGRNPAYLEWLLLASYIV